MTNGQNALFTTGSHCAQPDCNTLDFLPLQCAACRASFCKDHAPVFYHHCPSIHLLPDPPRPPPTKPGSSGDAVKGLIDAHTPADCKPSPSSLQLARTSKAKQILNKHFPKQAPPTSIQPPSATKKKDLSPAIQLILIKRRAKSGDPKKKEGDVPLDERWYGTLHCSVLGHPGSLPPKDQDIGQGTPVWFSKVSLLILVSGSQHACAEYYHGQNTVTGKVFDLITDSFRPQMGSLVHSQQLQLCVIRQSSSEPVVLTDQCSSNWGGLVRDGEAVWLTRKS